MKNVWYRSTKEKTQEITKNAVIINFLSLLVLNDFDSSYMQVTISHSQGTNNDSILHLRREFRHQFEKKDNTMWKHNALASFVKQTNMSTR